MGWWLNVSHYVDEELNITDQDCIIKALKELGWTEEQIIVETDRHLIGYRGKIRDETADITIPRQHVGGASNDLGFKRLPSGKWKIIISEFDTGNTKRSGHKIFDFKRRFKTEYGIAKIAKQCKTTKAGRGWTYKVTRGKKKTTVILTHK